MTRSNEQHVEIWREHPWFPIIEQTHQALEELIPGYTVLQIKQKFGGLRYYFRFPDPMPEVDGWSEEQLRNRCKEAVSRAEAWVDGYEHAQTQTLVLGTPGHSATVAVALREYEQSQRREAAGAEREGNPEFGRRCLTEADQANEILTKLREH